MGSQVAPVAADSNHDAVESPPLDASGPPAAVSICSLRKVFGGTAALGGADLTVQPGEIHGLLGENGAGKSTLIKILAGVYAADRGEISVAGKLLPPGHSPQTAAAYGLAFIHQDLGLVAELSVAENVALAVGYPVRRGMIRWKQVREQAARALRALDSPIDPSTRVAELSIAERSVVAIARCLAHDARLVVLDEPTASLAAGEVRTLFAILERLAEQSVGVVFVSHRMDEVRGLCRRATILRDGVTVATVDLESTTDAELIRLIVGRELEVGVSARPPRKDRAIALRAHEAVSHNVGPNSFDVGAGEVVALTGISGAGHAHIGDCLFGLRPLDSGQLSTAGDETPARSPREAVQRGIAYVPADRVSMGVAMRLSLRENLTLLPAMAETRTHWILPAVDRLNARRSLEQFDVRPPDPEKELSTLSGGNAQKVLLAKWIGLEPQILILNEPTTGVDVGAREEIYRLVRRSAERGTTVLVATSDFEEAVRLCDRVLVFRKGRVVQDQSVAETTVHDISNAAMHGDLTT